MPRPTEPAVQRWRNWSGSIAFTPRRIEHPRDEDALCGLVRATLGRSGTIRAAGAGHSSTPLVECDDTLVSLDAFTGITASDAGLRQARVGPGTPLETLGPQLYERDLALPNYGDVSTQTIGGAIATGTHGTGPAQRNLSAMLVGARLVDGNGEVRCIGAGDIELLRAARVSLGTLGIFTELTLQLVPSFDVDRREYAIGTDAALAQLDALVASNRSFDFYWYPRRDDIKLRLVNPVGGGSRPERARQLTRRSGASHQVIPTHTGIPHRFEECEYALPAGQGAACFAAVRRRVLQRWRHLVGWRVLWRTVAADDTDLSAAHGRATVTISLHQNSELPWREYFADIEPIFRAHGGRPHWAKKHGCDAAMLAPLYPRWDAFARVRGRFDPQGVFLTPYLRSLLGVPA